MFDGLKQDLKYSVRKLLRSPGYTAVTVLILALGIGANTAIFSMVNGVLLRPIAFEDADRLVVVEKRVATKGQNVLYFAAPEVADYRQQSQTVDLAEYHSMWFTILGGTEPQRVQTAVVSANFFDVLGVKPLHGRLFRPEDGAAGAEPVLVLSHGYWQQEFGGDPGVVGRSFELNDMIHTAVGILPPIPPYPDDNQVFMPTSACPFRSGEPAISNRTVRFLSLFGRLKPEATLGEAQSDTQLVTERLMEAYPEAYDAKHIETRVVSLADVIIGEARATLSFLFATVGLVLLITCANLANLSISRLIRRERELAVRTALGAGRGRLTRLLWTESTVLALLGGALGVVMAFALLRYLIDFSARFTSRAGEVRIDGVVLLFALGLALATGILVGALSSISLRRNLFVALREGGNQSTVRSGVKYVHRTLLVGELAVSFILLIFAGLMVRTLANLQRVDGGFDARNVLTFQLSLNWTKYNTPQSRAEFFSRLRERILALPGVEAAGTSQTIPLDRQLVFNRGLQVEGRPPASEAEPRTEVRVVGPGYFEAAGVGLLQGRDFAPSDDLSAPLVAIVNRSTARQLWEDQNPIGKRISINHGASWLTVVGVAAEVRHHGLATEAPDGVYTCYLQSPAQETNFMVRTAGGPMDLARPIRDLVHELDPQQPVTKIRPLDEVRRSSLAAPRLTTVLLGLFAGVALAIATVGVAGAIAYSVSQKTQEIGIRMALGADTGRMLWSVVREGVWTAVLGIAGGVVGAWLLSRLLSSLLYAVEPTDLATFVAVGGFLAAVVVVACFVPARRVSRVDPVLALRNE